MLWIGGWLNSGALKVLPPGFSLQGPDSPVFGQSNKNLCDSRVRNAQFEHTHS